MHYSLTSAELCLVPIYDAMADPTFLFTEVDMSKIASLPLYGGGGYDLPANAITTIAFLAGTCHKNDSPAMLFIILLGSVNRNKMECMLSAMGK